MTENKRYVIEKEKQSCNDPDFLEFIEGFKKKDSFWIFIREITGNKEWDEDTPPLAFTLTFNTTEFMRLEDELNELYNENEQLKKDNEWLLQCIKNQSVIIQELDSVIMTYNMEHKITIKLTEKDLKTLDKALSYYTHQKVEE